MSRAGFGRKLRQVRQAAEKTLKDVADFLDISVPYLSDVELGRRQPFPPARIRDLAVFLDAADEIDVLLTLAAKDRGEISFETKDDKTRELLVALDRRISEEGLNPQLIESIRKMLDR